MQWYVRAWRRTFDFNGRANRREYWWFVLVNVLLIVAGGGAGVLLVQSGSLQPDGPGVEVFFNVLKLFVLATVVPTLSLTVRRLHDSGYSGWWILINLVPVIGGLWLFVLTVLDSEPEANAWGPSPPSAA